MGHRNGRQFVGGAAAVLGRSGATPHLRAIVASGFGDGYDFWVRPGGMLQWQLAGWQFEGEFVTQVAARNDVLIRAMPSALLSVVAIGR